LKWDFLYSHVVAPLLQNPESLKGCPFDMLTVIGSLGSDDRILLDLDAFFDKNLSFNIPFLHHQIRSVSEQLLRSTHLEHSEDVLSKLRHMYKTNIAQQEATNELWKEVCSLFQDFQSLFSTYQLVSR
jgi:hypothetical protein